MEYSKSETIEAGMRFKTKSGIIVETTGITMNVESTEVFVHEVEIVEGIGQSNRYYHNLDTVKPI